MEDLKFLYRENEGAQFYVVCESSVDDAEILQVMDEMFALHAASISAKMSPNKVKQCLVDIVEQKECERYHKLDCGCEESSCECDSDGKQAHD